MRQRQNLGFDEQQVGAGCYRRHFSCVSSHRSGRSEPPVGIRDGAEDLAQALAPQAADRGEIRVLLGQPLAQGEALLALAQDDEVERQADRDVRAQGRIHRSEEHTSELQSLMRISYAVFCLKKKTKQMQIVNEAKSNT